MRAGNQPFWRHIDHGLKPEQHKPKNNQGIPSCMRTPANSLLVHTSREDFVTYNVSGCGRSTPEEMCEEHHDPDDQQHVNYAAGNVKGQESKQPKNN
jgi:hypothetical protein